MFVPPPALSQALPLSSSPPQAGDTVGVVRKEDGTLHFFVNGVAQGPAAWNVPPNIYAVADLYGQAAQATIVDDTGSGHGCTWDRKGVETGTRNMPYFEDRKVKFPDSENN